MSADPGNAYEQDFLRITADIASAYVRNNAVPAADLPAVIKDIHLALRGLGRESPPPLSIKPAVPVKRSVQRDYIVCLEDGKKFKMLKRYLRTHYDMSPDDYRQKWGLPADYPMVAPSYAELRSEFAKKIGLGKSSSRAKRKSHRATS